MQATTAGVTVRIVGCLDTSSYSLAVDVGGADGALLHSLMQRNPRLRVIVLERPEVAVVATVAARERGVADRAAAVGADFFEAVPAGDF